MWRIARRAGVGLSRCSWRTRTGRKLRSARVRTSPRLLPVNVKNTMGGFVGEKDGFEAGMGLAPWKALVNRSYDAVIAEAIDDEPPQALEVRRPYGNGLVVVRRRCLELLLLFFRRVRDFR